MNATNSNLIWTLPLNSCKYTIRYTIIVHLFRKMLKCSAEWRSNGWPRVFTTDRNPDGKYIQGLVSIYTYLHWGSPILKHIVLVNRVAIVSENHEIYLQVVRQQCMLIKYVLTLDNVLTLVEGNAFVFRFFFFFYFFTV